MTLCLYGTYKNLKVGVLRDSPERLAIYLVAFLIFFKESGFSACIVVTDSLDGYFP